MPLLEKVGKLYGEKGGIPYVKSFIMSRSLHDPRGLSLHCRCGGY
jgi:hypothetical protein